MKTIEIELNNITYLVQGECEYVVSHKATYDNEEEGDLQWIYRPLIIDSFDEDCEDYVYTLDELQQVLEIAFERKLEFKL
jgi:hypothetical protein